MTRPAEAGDFGLDLELPAAPTPRCSGCQAPSEEMHERGIMRRLDYCTHCVAVVDAYRADVDALHEALALQWRDGLEAIRSRYAGKLAAGELPY